MNKARRGFRYYKRKKHRFKMSEVIPVVTFIKDVPIFYRDIYPDCGPRMKQLFSQAVSAYQRITGETLEIADLTNIVPTLTLRIQAKSDAALSEIFHKCVLANKMLARGMDVTDLRNEISFYKQLLK